MTPAPLRRTSRSTLRRKAERARHDRAAVDAILDEALVCHVGVTVDDSPRVLPTTFVRLGDHLYLHGAAGNHLLRTIAAGAEACITVTLLDGLVLARSAFHHSMNYRSVVLFGLGERVTDREEQREALLALVDRMAPGRRDATRPPTPEELRATLVVRFPLDEGAAKVRTGGPVEEPEDLALDHWAGEVPISLTFGVPVPDARCSDAAPLPLPPMR